MTSSPPGQALPALIRGLVYASGRVSSGEVAAAAGVTRQAAHYHLRRMVGTGELRAVGAGRGRRYELRTEWSERLAAHGLEEDGVWRRVLEDAATVRGLPGPALAISKFAFLEMLNNAIDHSRSEEVGVSVAASDGLTFLVADEGVGAFEKVRRDRGLEDHLAAIQDLAKGKLTTDPSRHSGQGIFFTSKAVDVFVLTSNGWRWTVDNARGDESIARVPALRGTQVRFDVDPATTRVLRDVFDRYADPVTFEFDTTRTVVRLFEYGVAFVSRSEAKRLTKNLDRFREVVVDFRGVEEIGQGFADEIFRVWQSRHPEIQIVPVDMDVHVAMFVEQARKAYQDANATSPR